MFLRKLSHHAVRRAIQGRTPITSAVAATISSQSPFTIMNSREMSSAAAAAAAAAGATLEQLAVESPHVDVLRYDHKNVKFTLQNVDANSSALAYGFLESGLKPGNVVLSWLPSHFSEEVCLSFFHCFYYKVWNGRLTFPSLFQHIFLINIVPKHSTYFNLHVPRQDLFFTIWTHLLQQAIHLPPRQHLKQL